MSKLLVLPSRVSPRTDDKTGKVPPPSPDLVRLVEESMGAGNSQIRNKTAGE